MSMSYLKEDGRQKMVSQPFELVSREHRNGLLTSKDAPRCLASFVTDGQGEVANSVAILQAFKLQVPACEADQGDSIRRH